MPAARRGWIAHDRQSYAVYPNPSGWRPKCACSWTSWSSASVSASGRRERPVHARRACQDRLARRPHLAGAVLPSRISGPAAVADALRRTAWNVSGAAALLGISRATLHRRLNEFNQKRPHKDGAQGSGRQPESGARDGVSGRADQAG
ncbi:MAG TPA: helix-turn-helix domain-containing protein [Variovorax sp.]|nr:helix-turn-helix domain-containing protein [Variovorax sp.]